MTGTTLAKTTSLPPATLTAVHRCDRCGARAYVCALITAGRRGLLPLYFCAHHFNDNQDAIRDASVHLVDERWYLAATTRTRKER